jgi:TRAP-type C4-dicarboxylate transport system permease small subunit
VADGIAPVAADDQSPPGRSFLSRIGRTLATLRAIIQTTSAVLAWIAGLLTLVLMGIVVAEVILRKYFGTTLRGTIEYSEILLVFIVFGAVAHSQQVGGHVKTELLTSRLPPQPAALVRTGGLVVTAALLAWMTQATAARGWDSMQTGESRFGIQEVPVWPARLAIPVGLLFLTFEVIFCAVDAYRGRPGPAPSESAYAPTAAAAVDSDARS